ncbi:PTS lactose/cellobiose transporter subunit IIA [Dubosiella newyorkensis]|jgi:PTS system cellobiose-specific IIA component|uniref:PTS lactose/cellobiose transporter subunit IIA n=1 Tax=Dubosiella newyorkensis TaxID=1862672 RepID=A0A1U7NLH8_9FIRM|nr:PTS lactose/cellobiose transporter subunit IIA [Dubosiella newyorkensis]MCI9040532.1 PTS lactose/cellobiose transporter subunit IIA [Dubosiella newyorkensis]OLU45585.1 PTS lactose/cellobiose transporter subunit IIA [Dubosiella newyorkensis]
MEGLELICFQIISASGGAKSAYMAALEAAKEGDYEEAEKMIKEGDEMLNQGHAPHATLVQQEAAGNSPEVSLILIHAEDQMMGAESFKAMVEEFIEVYKQLDALKAKVA